MIENPHYKVLDANGKGVDGQFILLRIDRAEDERARRAVLVYAELMESTDPDHAKGIRDSVRPQMRHGERMHPLRWCGEFSTSRAPATAREEE